MAIRKPLVMLDGRISQLAVEDEIEMIVPIGHGVFLSGSDIDVQVQGTRTYLKSGVLQASASPTTENPPSVRLIDIAEPEGAITIVQDGNNLRTMFIHALGIYYQGVEDVSVFYPYATTFDPAEALHITQDYGDAGIIGKTVGGANQFIFAAAGSAEVTLYPYTLPVAAVFPQTSNGDSRAFSGISISGAVRTPHIFYPDLAITNTYAAFSTNHSEIGVHTGFIENHDGAYNDALYWIVLENWATDPKVAIYYTAVTYSSVGGTPALSRILLSTTSYAGRIIRGHEKPRKSTEALFAVKETASTWVFYWVGYGSPTPLTSSPPSIGGLGTDGVWEIHGYHHNNEAYNYGCWVSIAYSVDGGRSFFLKEYGNTGTWTELIPLLSETPLELAIIPSNRHVFFAYSTAVDARVRICRFNVDTGTVAIIGYLEDTYSYAVLNLGQCFINEASGMYKCVLNLSFAPPEISYFNAVGSLHHTPTLYFRIE